MFEKHNVKIFKDAIIQKLLDKVYNILEAKDLIGEKIRIMPNAHPLKNSIIGLTTTLEQGKIDPKRVGYNVGLGTTVYKLGRFNPDIVEFDTFLDNEIPTGDKIYDSQKVPREAIRIINMVCKTIGFEHKENAINALGTLGSQHNFISLAKDDDEVVYLIIRSDSRDLGASMVSHFTSSPYLEGRDSTTYFRLMQAVVEYASINRNMIANKVFNYFKIKPNTVEITESIQNYIADDGILRKGAIQAYEDQKVVIPMSPMNSVILGIGKGIEEWNYSAPADHFEAEILPTVEIKKMIKVFYSKEVE